MGFRDRVDRIMGDYYKQNPEKLDAHITKTYESMDALMDSFVDKTDSTFINRPNESSAALKGRRLSNGQQAELRTNPGSFTYKSAIIANKAYDPGNRIHRNIVYDSNAIYAAARKRIIAAVTSIDVKFYHKNANKDKDAEEEDLEPYPKAQTLWENLGGMRILAKALWKSMPHGGIIYEPIKVPGIWYTEDPFFIRSWDEARIKDYEYGFPVVWEVKPINKELADYEIDVRKWGLSSKLNKDPDQAKRPTHAGFFFDPMFNGVYHPNPWFFGSWDNTIDYETIKEARNFYAQREGAGWKVIGIPANLYEKYKPMLEGKLQNVNKEVGMIIPIMKDYPVEISNQGGAGVAMDFNSVLEDIRSDIIADVGFPKRWLYGDDAGAMESSGKDRLQVMDAIKYIINQWIPCIKLVMKYHGIPDIIVKAPYEMLQTEEEKVNIENLHVQTVMMKMGILTPNELRQELGYEELSEEGLDDVLPNVPEDDPNNDDGPKPESNNTKQTAERVKNDAVKQMVLKKAVYCPTCKREYRKVLVDETGALGGAIFCRVCGRELGDIPKQDTEDNPYLKLDTLFSTLNYDELESYLGVSRNTIGKIKSKFKSDSKIGAIKCDSLVKCDAVSLGNGIYQIEGIVVPVQKKYYENHGYTAVRSYEKLNELFTDPTKPKEYRIGVNKQDDHESIVPLEISETESVGKVVLERMTDKGIWGKIQYNVDKAQKIIPEDNWILDHTLSGKRLNTSVALRSVDIPLDRDSKYETNHDIRSFIFTRSPRNTLAGGV